MNTKKPSSSIDDCLTQVDYTDHMNYPIVTSTGNLFDGLSGVTSVTLPNYRNYNFELANVVEHLPIHMIKKYLLAVQTGWPATDKDAQAIDLIKDINPENKLSTIKRLKLLGW